ncbi:MAG TPA: hypothetical protein VJ385_17630 [Fibrobacteria bacterium]|nr:hypothetical protein [Fibrobacteria bacterium]
MEIAGNSGKLWLQNREKLLSEISDLLEWSDPESLQKLKKATTSSAVLVQGAIRDFNSTLENDKMRAEIEGLFAKAERENAEAVKIRAEANSIQFATKVRKLKLTVRVYKIFLQSDMSADALLFCSMLDQLNDVLKEIEL